MALDLEKLKNIVQLLNDDKVSNKQFVENFGILVKHIKEAKESAQQVSAESKKLLTEALKEAEAYLGQEYSRIVAEVKINADKRVLDLEKKTKEMLETATLALDQIRSIEVRNGKDGMDGRDGKNADETKIIEKVLEKIPEDTPEQILEKIRALGKKGMSVKDLADVSDFTEEILHTVQSFIPRALTSLYDVQVKGTLTDGQVLSYNASLKKWVPGASVGGWTELSATGTINSINKDFTFTQKPTYIIQDGVWYKENAGWTWTGSTATMSVPVQFSIFGLV